MQLRFGASQRAFAKARCDAFRGDGGCRPGCGDVAVVEQPIKDRGRHDHITEDSYPFSDSAV
jgi:hypothetical protein